MKIKGYETKREKKFGIGRSVLGKNGEQTHDMKIANRSFENVAQFKYLGTTVTNQNLVQEEIKKRLN
jgi:hypothetical protein